MWLKFTKNYSGKLGFFTKDTRLDLLDKTAVEYFLKFGFAQKTCPPWEDGINRNQFQFEQLRSAVTSKSQKLSAAKSALSQVQSMVQTLPALSKKVKSLEDELKAANQKLRKFAADNGIPLPKESNEKADKKTENAAAAENAADTAGQAAPAGKTEL